MENGKPEVKANGKSNISNELKTIIKLLYKNKLIQFAECDLEKNTITPVWKLEQGTITPVYINARSMISVPNLTNLAITEYIKKIQNTVPKLKNSEKEYQIFGVPQGASSISARISQMLGIGELGVRKQKKEHGVDNSDGTFGITDKRKMLLAIEDVTVKGDSLTRTIRPLQKDGYTITDAFTLILREEEAIDNLKKLGVNLHYVFTLEQMMKVLKEEDLLPHKNTFEAVETFMKNPEKFTERFKPEGKKKRKNILQDPSEDFLPHTVCQII
jgi:orotate phosphoribosyltransferase